MIPYGRQQVTDADVEAVVAVLRSDFLTQGPAVPSFELAVAAKVGARHAIAVNSATSALHIACLALGLGPGDLLWTVPTTFVASANCGRYCGADVDFVDIDPDSWNMSVPALRAKLLHAQQIGRLPKIVLPVHLCGQPTEQEAIWGLAGEFGFKVIEDASHSIGASRNGQSVGNCRWSDITVFSFHPVKIITSGEGGMALTNDKELARRLSILRSHGISRDVDGFESYVPDSESKSLGPPAWYYEQQVLGFNYRLIDIQAALGESQLSRIEEYVERRNMLAKRYGDALATVSLMLPNLSPGNRSAFHLYVVRLPPGVKNGEHRRLFDELRQRGIGVNLHYMPVHLQPYYRKLGFAEGDFPEAEAYGKSAITLPLYPSMTDEQHAAVVSAVKDTL